MTDPDVKRELEENEERAERQRKDEDGGVLGTVDELFEPVVDVIEGDDRPDAKEARIHGAANDADQRPE